MGDIEKRRVHAQRVGGRFDHEECVSVREIIQPREDFDPGERRRLTEALSDVTPR